MRCIICGENSQPSLEHIISEVLGNKKFTIRSICERCNNLLGTKVDSYLSDYLLVKIMREAEDIPTKSGKKVYAFDGTHRSEDGVLFQRKYGEIKLIPVPEDTPNGIRLSVSSDDLKSGFAVARKKLKHMKKTDGTIYSPSEIDDIINYATISEPQETDLHTKIDASIDLIRYSLAFIKIAYEYASKIFGECYWEDKTGTELRHFLYKATTLERSEIADYFTPIEIRSFVKLFDNELSEQLIFKYDKLVSDRIRHSLLLFESKNNLFCQISLFRAGISSATVLISKDAQKLAHMFGEICHLVLILADGTVLDTSETEFQLYEL